MQTPPAPSFDDAPLRTALRRALPRDAAPPDVRERVARALSAAPEPIGEAGNGRITFAGRGARGPFDLFSGGMIAALGLAAVMLVAVGVVGVLLAHRAAAVPRGLELAMVARHDECCKNHKHQAPAVPQQDFARMGQYLRQELNHPVLAADLTRDGWHFRGAAMCPVGTTLSAHLIFDRGEQTLSVFSLPPAAYPTAAAGSHYDGEVGHHPITVLVRDGAVLALVAYAPQGNLTVADLEALMSAHEADVTVAAAPGPRITVAGIDRE